MPQNILVVVLDAARRDALEPYGAPAGSSPAIAQLAERGTAMSDVYATGCWTVPSHASIFTGLMPRAAGLARATSPAAAKPALDALDHRLLPEVLRRAGYWTAATSANLWVSEAGGFANGFEDFEQVDSDRQGRIQAKRGTERLRWVAEAALGHVDDGAQKAEAQLTGWIKRAQGERRPFFWFMNLMEAHSPYLPPRRHSGSSLAQRIRASEDARQHYTLTAIWQTCARSKQVPEPVLARMRKLYQASIRYMDSCLGRILERLDGAGILDDTLVVVIADHGENLGEAGLIAHALSLDNRLIHVPLIAAGPEPVTGAIHSLADLPRFLAEAARLDDHPWTDGPPPGIGLAQFDPPLDADDDRTAERLARADLSDAFDQFTTPLSCAVQRNAKVLRRGDVEEIYDLDADPLETSPLGIEDAPHLRDRVSTLRRALEHPAMSLPAESQAAPSASDASDSEVRDLEERMRLLGYL